MKCRRKVVWRKDNRCNTGWNRQFDYDPNYQNYVLDYNEKLESCTGSYALFHIGQNGLEIYCSKCMSDCPDYQLMGELYTDTQKFIQDWLDEIE